MILPSSNGAGSLERIGALLRATSEMLGAHIEIRASKAGFEWKPVFSRETPPCCALCARAEEPLYRQCTARRDGGADGPSRMSSAPAHWTCPRGCEISLLPLQMPNWHEAKLVAVRPKSAPGASHPDRPEALRFLTQLCTLLSDHLSITSELTSVSGELNHRCEELDLLYTISQRLTGQEDMCQAIRMILEQARGAIGAKGAFLGIPERRIFEAALISDNGTDRATIESLRKVTGILQTRYRQGCHRFFSGSHWDLDPDEPLFDQPAQILAVALQTQGEVRGVLGLLHFDPVMKPRLGDLKLLESLSERIAMAVASSDLYDNLKEFLMATVKSLVSALEAKDRYTCGHSERVNLLSMLIGKTMGLGDEDLEVLRWASILHDVGKIGMPESILNKPGRLTSEEYEIMKEHPDRGYKVLSPIRQLATASLAVRSHHEMVDGRGYPLGLHSDEIPLLARVIAVADTYDALTSTRSYRPRRSVDQAFAVIQSVRGTQLDSAVVDVLETLIPFIREHEVMLKIGELDLAIDDDEEAAGEARAA